MLRFFKMNGLGNDFALVDARTAPFAPGPDAIAALADRVRGIGFDQMIAVEPPKGAGDAFMRIHNADGGEVAACGNATRCLADRLIDETGRAEVAIETAAGLLAARRADADRIAVDMGVPRLAAAEIPLAAPAPDTTAVPVPAADAFGLPPAVCVNVGNPHAVFFVPAAAAVPLARAGPAIEREPLFPERVNVSFASPRADGGFDVAVWERGAGATRACGTAACAVAVAAHRTGRARERGRPIAIHLPGGRLDVAWRPDGHATMEGPVAFEYAGTIDPVTFAWRRDTAAADRAAPARPVSPRAPSRPPGGGS